jgi:hypothetical protein
VSIWLRTVTLLTPVIENDIYGKHRLEPPPVLISGEEEYEVEGIINHRVRRRRSDNNRLRMTTEYLVRWKGYSPTEDSWETEDDLENAKESLENYKRAKGLQ